MPTKTTTKTTSKTPVITCSPRSLPKDQWEEAARTAIEINPVNAPRTEGLRGFAGADDSMKISALTAKYWHTSNGVKLKVAFLDNAPVDLRRRIVEHLNAWGKTGNVKFVQSKIDPQVRIAREGGDNGGYWSYLGTDILQIPAGQPTMNLEAFTMATPDSEFVRVIRHEAGHTLGFPHEHMRKALVAKIDPKKAIAYFKATQGWTAAETKAQVLTPLDEKKLTGTIADARSIMCYQIPGTITVDGKPIIGGKDIDEVDYAFVGRLYPKRR